MPATPRSVEFTKEDFEDRASYDDLNGDYEATLVDVTDIDAKTGNYGWGFVFMVKGLKLTSRVWLKGGGAWKVREVFNSLGAPIAPGSDITQLDPNTLVGRSNVVTVGREEDRNGKKNPDGTVKTYASITKHTPLVTEAIADFTDMS